MVVQTNIPEILEWGHSRNFEPKILATGMCSASQIVSHILRMWRLIIPSLWMHLFHSNNVNSFFSQCLSEFCRKFENKGKLNRLNIFK